MRLADSVSVGTYIVETKSRSEVDDRFDHMLGDGVSRGSKGGLPDTGDDEVADGTDDRREVLPLDDEGDRMA